MGSNKFEKFSKNFGESLISYQQFANMGKDFRNGNIGKGIGNLVWGVTGLAANFLPGGSELALATKSVKGSLSSRLAHMLTIQKTLNSSEEVGKITNDQYSKLFQSGVLGENVDVETLYQNYNNILNAPKTREGRPEARIEQLLIGQGRIDYKDAPIVQDDIKNAQYRATKEGILELIKKADRQELHAFRKQLEFDNRSKLLGLSTEQIDELVNAQKKILEDQLKELEKEEEVDGEVKIQPKTKPPYQKS